MIKRLDAFEQFLDKFLKTYTGIFLLCFWQVIMVSVNTYQIANHKWIGMAIFGFWISFFWTYNVSILAFGNIRQRLVYAAGGMCGVLTGGYGTYWYYVM